MRLTITTCLVVICVTLAALLRPNTVLGQSSEVRYGNEVPTEVRTMYDKALTWLAENQEKNGDWPSQVNPQQGAGITGMCIMAFLATGEDPNFGKYAENIRRATRCIITKQDAKTGYLDGHSMYHHGFGMLALSEVYGVIDEELLWVGATSGEESNKRTLGRALELAVECAVTSQKDNPWKAWRYSPQATDADTSVSGAVLMGLLAARNAGVKIPDENIDNAIDYFKSMTTKQGDVGYSGVGAGGSANLPCIALLVYSISKRKELDQFDSVKGRVISQMGSGSNNSYPEYYRYYAAQALFQADFDSWQKWNTQLIRELKELQQSDGSFPGSMGQTYGTAMSLLALGLNYRFLPIYER